MGIIWPMLTGAKLVLAHAEMYKDIDYLKTGN